MIALVQKMVVVDLYMKLLPFSHHLKMLIKYYWNEQQIILTLILTHSERVSISLVWIQKLLQKLKSLMQTHCLLRLFQDTVLNRMKL